MSIIVNIGNNQWVDKKLSPEEVKKIEASSYTPTAEESDVRKMIIQHFTIGYENLYKPRREFNDLSQIDRMQVDQMAFNTYQSNNGQPPPGDQINAWRSRAIRPIVRNKCISVAAHATARLIFPKIFALNKNSQNDQESAKVMGLLMEYAAEQSRYSKTALLATLSAIINPLSVIYTEYGEVFRNVKDKKGEDGKWTVKKMLDENFSGFKDEVVPPDEFFYENFYENDVQKQAFLIRRRVISYSNAEVKYKDFKNWKYVKPGVQTIFSDANSTFYNVYDDQLRQNMVEEVLYWNKSLDLYQIMVNGVLLTECDNPNPRIDKQYPFITFGYEYIDEGKCICYKSLAFKLQHDADIVNSLYPMILDGTYLNIMRPMVATGAEMTGSDVIVPGMVTTFSDKDAKLTAIPVADNLSAGINSLQLVEKSISESSQDPIQQGITSPGSSTAYEISRIEQNANTVLGLFVKMIGQFVKAYGELRVSDIIQHLTIVDVDKILDDENLVYKTFFVEGSDDGSFIEFNGDLPTEDVTEEDEMVTSYDILENEGKNKVYKTNPKLFRDRKYKIVVSPDVLLPRSEDLERAMKLEVFDRGINLGGIVDQNKLVRDFLFGSYSNVKDPDEYLKSIQSPEDINGQIKQAMTGKSAQAPSMQGLEANNML